MKKHKLISLIVAFMILFSACSRSDIEERNKNNRFIDTKDTYIVGGTNHKVIYDSKTYIVYLLNCGYNGGGITALYDENGVPMTLDRYNETK